MNFSIESDPNLFKQDISHDAWKEATEKEYDALIKNGTCKLLDHPYRTKPIGCQWVYKNKYKEMVHLINTKWGL